MPLHIAATQPHCHSSLRPGEVGVAAVEARVLQRERRLLSVLAAQGGDILALPLLTERVYEEVPKHLLPWAQRTLLAHLIKLEQEGRAHQLGEGWQLAVPQ